MVDGRVIRVGVVVVTVTFFMGMGFTKQMDLIDERRKKSFEIINRVKDEERPKRIALLKEQGRL